MPTYRKGEDQFELKHKALLQPQGFDNPETVSALLDSPTARIYTPPGEGKKPVVSEKYHEPIHTTEPSPDEPGEVDEYVSFAPFYPHREYPVSGADIAKLKRGR